jgi:Predicted nucleic acid-binding protein, contains PIN domain
MSSYSDNIVLVDTSSLAAIMNKSDQFHQKAVGVYKKLLDNDYSLVTTNFIIAETHALLLKNTNDINLGLKWLGQIAFQAFHVIHPDETE